LAENGVTHVGDAGVLEIEQSDAVDDEKRIIIWDTVDIKT